MSARCRVQAWRGWKQRVAGRTPSTLTQVGGCTGAAAAAAAGGREQARGAAAAAAAAARLRPPAQQSPHPVC